SLRALSTLRRNRLAAGRSHRAPLPCVVDADRQEYSREGTAVPPGRQAPVTSLRGLSPIIGLSDTTLVRGPVTISWGLTQNLRRVYSLTRRCRVFGAEILCSTRALPGSDPTATPTRIPHGR